MSIPLPLLLGGAGILGGLLKSQQYFPADEAPSRAQIYGGALGGGLGGYLGGGLLTRQDPLGILGNIGGTRPQDIRAEDVALPKDGIGISRTQHIPIQNFVRAERSASEGSDVDRLISALERYSQPRNQGFQFTRWPARPRCSRQPRWLLREC